MAVLLCFGGCIVAACGSKTPIQSAPEPASVPAPAPAAPAATVIAPTTLTGTWSLNVAIQSGNRPPQRTRRDPQASMTLTTRRAATAMQGGPAQQYEATITLPGYSRPARRGRAGQAAAWWLIPGDSMVVQFTQGQQSRGEVQLRAALQGTAMRGEVWYVALASGSNFQLGTFSGTKNR
jgi:hypothetical protein